MAARKHFVCTGCFVYEGTQLARHVRKCKHWSSENRSNNQLKQIGKQLVINSTEAQNNISCSNNHIVNPDHITDKTYTKDEVLLVLEAYGHTIVPNMAGRVALTRLPVSMPLAPYVPVVAPQVPCAPVAKPVCDSGAVPVPCAPVAESDSDEPPLSCLTDDLKVVHNSSGDSSECSSRLLVVSPKIFKISRRPRVLDSSSEEETSGIDVIRPDADVVNMPDAVGDGPATGLANEERPSDEPRPDQTPGCSFWSKTPPRTSKDNCRVAMRNLCAEVPTSSSSDMSEEPAGEACTFTAAYTKGIKGNLASSGWYSIPLVYANHSIFKKFGGRFESLLKSKRVCRKHVTNVQRITYVMGDKCNDFSTLCIDTDKYTNANTFLMGLGVDYHTLYNYNKSMKQFIKFAIKCLTKDGSDPDERARLSAVLEDFVDIGTCQDKKSKEAKRIQRSTAAPIVSPYEVVEVLHVYKADFLNMLQKATRTKLNREAVCFVNRYMASHIILTHGCRPGVMDCLTAQQVSHHMSTQIDDHCVLLIAQHKTGPQFTAKIVLDLEWISIFETYTLHIREAIVKETYPPPTLFFLQHDGTPFTKFSEAPVHLQRKKGLPTYSANDARKSYETYNQNLPRDLQKDMADFACHSEHTRDSEYRVADNRKAVYMYKTIAKLRVHYGSHSVSEPCPDSLALSINTPHAEAETPDQTPTKRLRVTPSRTSQTPVKTPTKRRREADESPDDVQLRRTPVKTPRRERPSNVVTPISPSSTPMSLNKRSAYLEKELITKYGDMLNANVPGVPELKRAHGLSHEVATKLNRSLRYKVEKARELRCAEKLLNAEAKRLRVPIAELVDVPVVTLDDKRLKHITQGVKVSSLNISKHMASLMTRAKGAVGPKQNNAQLEQLIRSQCWPNIFIQTCPGDKGEGVFSGILPIRKGTVVCDYHGADRSKSEGEKVMLETEGAVGNYVFFYQFPGQAKRCKDACSECGCHTDTAFKRTVGRKINHSRKHANLKASFKMLDGAAILMVAQEDIAPRTELTFDYGVRRAEDGSKLDWLTA